MRKPFFARNANGEIMGQDNKVKKLYLYNNIKNLLKNNNNSPPGIMKPKES